MKKHRINEYKKTKIPAKVLGLKERAQQLITGEIKLSDVDDKNGRNLVDKMMQELYGNK